MNACLQKSSTSQICEHILPYVLIGLHYSNCIMNFTQSSLWVAARLGMFYCVENICPGYAMWPDNPGFPAPSVLVEGISLCWSHRCLGSWFLLKHWSICCMNPCGFKGTWLRNLLSSVPVIMYGQFTVVWKHWENVSLAQHPTCIKIKGMLWFPLRVILTEYYALDRRPGDEIIWQETCCWQLWCGLIPFCVQAPFSVQSVKNAQIPSKCG